MSKWHLGKTKIQSVNAMKSIKEVSPKFAEHMYHRNRVVEAFAMSELGGVEILEQPVCKKCEKPCWNVDDPTFISTGDEDKDREIRNGYCVECGTTSKDTLTVRQYLIQEMGLQEANIEEIESKIYGGV